MYIKTISVEKNIVFCIPVAMVTIKRPNMASLLDEILFETAGQGPPPTKDFYQLIITQKEVFSSTQNDYSTEYRKR